MSVSSADRDGGGATSAPTATPILAAQGLVKSFNGVTVLHGVDLTILPGEVHGLLGANGCGKSTLIKILAGFHEADAGSIIFNGKAVPMPLGPRGRRPNGMAFVHQDLGLVPGSTVLEHMALDSYGARTGTTRIRWRSERRRVSDLLDRFEVDIDPRRLVETLTPVQRAMVAVVRAVGGQEQEEALTGEGRSVLVLDEPTVFLPREEIELLFALLQKLKAQGDSVILVSHDLDEVMVATDRVTVLRDGYLVGTAVTKQSTPDQVVEMILGAAHVEISRMRPQATTTGTDVLVAEDLTGERVKHLSLTLREGEVLGVTGLAGSGFEELPELLFGARPLYAGSITMGALKIKKPKPAQMMSQGVVLIPADRKAEGAAQELTVTENLSLPFLTRRAKGWSISWKALRQQALHVCERLNVVPLNIGLVFRNLSGGNQQKALLGKWLELGPRVMLLNEPTQGVDIGARADIMKLIRAAVADGMSVLCATSDHDQLVEMADRVIVLSNGRVTSEFPSAEINKDTLANAVYKGVSA